MHETAQQLPYGDPIPLRWDFGPLSFGWAINAFKVSWSSPTAKDLLVTRCWKGIYLYPSAQLSEAELNRQPLQVCGDPLYQTFGYPVDWNQDGEDELLLTDRCGFIHLAERRGSYPDLRFELLGPLRDRQTGLPFNIPWDNPHHPEQDDMNGYVDTHFYNYAYIVRYPLSPEDRRAHLIVGDWAGNLWWLADHSTGVGPPQYSGLPYTKPNVSKRYARRFLDEYGTDYVRPAEKICDEAGKPYLLGDGVDGTARYPGGVARPALYPNRQSGRLDLLVMAGAVRNQLFYLQRVVEGDQEKPRFRNLGEVAVHGLDLSRMGITSYYSMPIAHEVDGWNDLLLTAGCRMAVLRNRRLPQGKPEFEFSHWLSGSDALAYGYMFTDILRDAQGDRYLLDVTGGDFLLYPLRTQEGGIRLSPNALVLQDQNGPFRVDGETDPQGGKEWGFHRTARWDFDGSGRQHLIVGTDRGLLYLLIDDGAGGEGGGFRYRSVGPLRDQEGRTIKVHNRACAAAIDLDGDGRQDLVVGGASYQLGITLDPQPGAGFYYLRHLGLDAAGLPILAARQPLAIEGCDLSVPMNSHVHMQALDLDGDGERELIAAVAHDGWLGKVLRPIEGRIGLRHSGVTLARLCIDEYLLDVDDDGELEHVFAGGEVGVGHYRKVGR